MDVKVGVPGPFLMGCKGGTSGGAILLKDNVMDRSFKGAGQNHHAAFYSKIKGLLDDGFLTGSISNRTRQSLKPYVARGDLMKRLCEKAKVKEFGFHAIRHLTASILYHNGCDVSLIQRVLRHKNATTTNRYLQNLGTEAVRKGLEDSLKGPAEVIDLVERKKAIGEK